MMSLLAKLVGFLSSQVHSTLLHSVLSQSDAHAYSTAYPFNKEPPYFQRLPSLNNPLFGKQIIK